MVFASAIFLHGFLPLALAGALLAGTRGRNLFLLLASLVFYAWGGIAHLPLLLALVGVNFVAGLLIEDEDRPFRGAILAAAIALDLLALLHYKYTGFLLENLSPALAALHLPAPSWAAPILPLGISFFTFHLLSYLIDIWRGAAAPQRNPIDFALYICFFPQLIAGPIIRYHDVEAQLTARRVTLDKFASGTERFILGLAKKMLIANPVGAVADKVFGLDPQQLSASVAWFGLLAYAVQLYYDFSGYSDMAIGLGRMFGFEFLENFNYPFVSRSISEFWRRWHISLSNWFRDYLYLPLVLGAARRRAARGIRAKIDDRPYLALVFLICGLWHGAAWTFVIWGAIHGVFLALERGRFGKFLERAPRPAQHLYVLAVILFAWVFFRAESLARAWGMLRAMAGARGPAAWSITFSELVSDRQTVTLMLLGLIGMTGAFTWLARDWRARAAQLYGQIAATGDGESRGESSLALARPVLLLGLMGLCLMQVAAPGHNPFLYFRF